MRRNQKGFSLIELMIVVTILGIISAIAIPTYMGVQKKGKRTEYKTNLEIVKLLEEKRHAEQGTYVEAANTVDLGSELPHFQPGDPANLLYEYSVDCRGDCNTLFTAIATGKANGPDPGKKFCIDQDNVKGEDAACP
jgi:prepilin-type N-terminal cleavage/methylation domain-containing protein